LKWSGVESLFFLEKLNESPLDFMNQPLSIKDDF